MGYLWCISHLCRCASRAESQEKKENILCCCAGSNRSCLTCCTSSRTLGHKKDYLLVSMNTLNFISSNPDIATPVDPRQPGYFTSIRSDSRAGSHSEFLAADKFGPVPPPHLTAGDVTQARRSHGISHGIGIFLLPYSCPPWRQILQRLRLLVQTDKFGG